MNIWLHPYVYACRKNWGVYVPPTNTLDPSWVRQTHYVTWYEMTDIFVEKYPTPRTKIKECISNKNLRRETWVLGILALYNKEAKIIKGPCYFLIV